MTRSNSPPKLLVFIVRRLLPSESRETVLGDLHERYQSPFRYALDAAGAVPAAVFGRIRRATPLPFLLLEATLLYAAYLAAAYATRQYAGAPNPTQLLWGTLVLLAGQRIRDAYTKPLEYPKPEETPFVRLNPRHWKLFLTFLLTGTVYLTVYFSDGIMSLSQDVFRRSHLFPHIMTRLQSVWYCTLAILPLRIWLDVYREDRPHVAS